MRSAAIILFAMLIQDSVKIPDADKYRLQLLNTQIQLYNTQIDNLITRFLASDPQAKQLQDSSNRVMIELDSSVNNLYKVNNLKREEYQLNIVTGEFTKR